MEPTLMRHEDGHDVLVLGFTGGDYYQWAIVTEGGGVHAVPVQELMWTDALDKAEDIAFKRSREAILTSRERRR